MKQPIRLEILSNDDQHFCLYFDRPGRVEVLLVDGDIIAHAYQGTKDDPDQDPEFAYDGHMASEMESIGL